MRVPQAADVGDPVDLSVVIPFRNPGPALRQTAIDLLASLDEAGISHEVLAIDDGSTDGSARTLRGLGPHLSVLRLPRNRGKGAALRAGLELARGRHVGIIDGDGDIDPRHLARYLGIARAGGFEVVAASRDHPDSVSLSTPSRKAMSRMFQAVVATLFSVGARDTQVGCKVFERDALRRVLPFLREDRFAFDLEFLVAAHQVGITRIHEAPVELNRRVAGSTIGPKATLRLVVDTFAVLARLHLTSAYQPVPGPQARALQARWVAAPGPADIQAPPVVDVLGVKVADEHPGQMVQRALARNAIAAGPVTAMGMHITTLNALDEPGVRQALSEADFLHADGVSVSLLAKAAGAQDIAAVPTTDLAPLFLTCFAARTGRPARVAIIGGEPGVSETALARLAESLDVTPAVAAHGYHTNWIPVLEDLRDAKPDIVFVGLGMPKEARWIQQWKPHLPPALIVTCGGWPRLLSGEQSRAPRWVLQMHLEFAWRWVSDFERTNARYSRGLMTFSNGFARSARNRLRNRR